MFVCQWHLDILYGKQADAVRVMRAWVRRSSPARSSSGQKPPGFWLEWLAHPHLTWSTSTGSRLWPTLSWPWRVCRHPSSEVTRMRSRRSWFRVSTLGGLPSARALLTPGYVIIPCPVRRARPGCAPAGLQLRRPRRRPRSGMMHSSPSADPEGVNRWPRLAIKPTPPEKVRLKALPENSGLSTE